MTSTATAGLQLTPADRITVGRGVLGIGCAVLVALVLLDARPARTWLLFGLAAVTVALDWVDGTVARATNTVTERGARWDREVDSAVLLVLCLAVAETSPWALLIGAARYLFWLGGRVRPAWRGKLPFRQSRRWIAGYQGVALVIALAPVLPLWVGQVVTAVAAGLLVFSFGRDIVHLESRGSRRLPEQTR